MFLKNTSRDQLLQKAYYSSQCVGEGGGYLPAGYLPARQISTQGSKLKKSLGHLLATNWRNIVARCKFSVASLYNQNNVQVLLVESV